MRIVVLDRDVAEAISTMLHRAEKAGHCFTEFEDEMWSILTSQIRTASPLKEDQR